MTVFDHPEFDGHEHSLYRSAGAYHDEFRVLFCGHFAQLSDVLVVVAQSVLVHVGRIADLALARVGVGVRPVLPLGTVGTGPARPGRCDTRRT